MARDSFLEFLRRADRSPPPAPRMPPSRTVPSEIIDVLLLGGVKAEGASGIDELRAYIIALEREVSRLRRRCRALALALALLLILLLLALGLRP